MSNYAESKKTLDAIRQKYGCQGEILFRTALQHVLDYGMSDMLDDWCYMHQVDEVNQRHDEAEAEGKNLFVTRGFELAILECAREIAAVEAYDLLLDIQREVWLGGDGMDYKRVMQLLVNCMSWITDDHCESAETLDTLEYIGFDDYEIETLGFGYLLDAREGDK